MPNDSMDIPPVLNEINGDDTDEYEHLEHVPTATIVKSYSTQTEEEDAVDSSIVLPHFHDSSGADSGDVVDGSSRTRTDKDSGDGGFLSNLFTMVLPKKRNKLQGSSAETLKSRNSRTTATQTEEQDPITARGQHLSYLVIQDLAIGNPVNVNIKDEVLDTLCYCVLEILEKHSILFNGMVRRIEVTQYHMFASVANELFEANAHNETETVQLRITWGRIVSLFAFAVRLVQEYRQDSERVDSITRYLASYVTKHIIPFVQVNGGWDGLVEQFPPPEDGDAQLRRAIVWSGLCVGLVATMYVSSLLR